MTPIQPIILQDTHSPRLCQARHQPRANRLPRSIQAWRAAMQRPLIVHAHQRWTSGTERHRQLFSRLAAHHPVLFIEEAVEGSLDSAALKLSEPHPNILRAVPILPYDSRSADDLRRAGVAQLLRDRLFTDPSLRERFIGAIQWFCSPLDAPAFMGRFGTIGVVYDRACGLFVRKQLADESGSREHRKRERRLLREATVVFTDDCYASPGGRILRSRCAAGCSRPSRRSAAAPCRQDSWQHQ